MSSRPSYLQLERLAEFLEQNPGIASGKLRTSAAKAENKKKWMQLAPSINNLGDALKNGVGWAKYWAEKKCALKRLCAGRSSRNRLENLSELDKRLLKAMGGLIEVVDKSKPCEAQEPASPEMMECPPSPIWLVESTDGLRGTVGTGDPFEAQEKPPSPEVVEFPQSPNWVVESTDGLREAVGNGDPFETQEVPPSPEVVECPQSPNWVVESIGGSEQVVGNGNSAEAHEKSASPAVVVCPSSPEWLLKMMELKEVVGDGNQYDTQGKQLASTLMEWPLSPDYTQSPGLVIDEEASYIERSPFRLPTPPNPPVSPSITVQNSELTSDTIKNSQQKETQENQQVEKEENLQQQEKQQNPQKKEKKKTSQHKNKQQILKLKENQEIPRSPSVEFVRCSKVKSISNTKRRKNKRKKRVVVVSAHAFSELVASVDRLASAQETLSKAVSLLATAFLDISDKLSTGTG